MNGKSLSSMNARPAKSLNPRPGAMSAGTMTRQPDSIKTVQSTKAASGPIADKPVGSNPAMNADIPEFVNMMKSMVGGFSILSDEVIAQNLKMAGGHGMTADDRTISFECADYLMSNLAYIIMGLVLDMDFKNAFLESLSVEMNIDKQPADVKKKTRDSMRDPHTYTSAGSIVIGVTSFTPNIETELMNKMKKSFDDLNPYAAEFDAEIAKLTAEQKMEYGAIFGNFMYLIRAFTHNDLFMSYVITVIEKVKDVLKHGNK